MSHHVERECSACSIASASLSITAHVSSTNTLIHDGVCF